MLFKAACFPFWACHVAMLPQANKAASQVSCCNKTWPTIRAAATAFSVIIQLSWGMFFSFSNRLCHFLFLMFMKLPLLLSSRHVICHGKVHTGISSFMLAASASFISFLTVRPHPTCPSHVFHCCCQSLRAACSSAWPAGFLFHCHFVSDAFSVCYKPSKFHAAWLQAASAMLQKPKKASLSI